MRFLDCCFCRYYRLGGGIYWLYWRVTDALNVAHCIFSLNATSVLADLCDLVVSESPAHLAQMVITIMAEPINVYYTQ